MTNNNNDFPTSPTLQNFTKLYKNFTNFPEFIKSNLIKTIIIFHNLLHQIIWERIKKPFQVPTQWNYFHTIILIRIVYWRQFSSTFLEKWRDSSNIKIFYFDIMILLILFDNCLVCSWNSSLLRFISES